MTNTINLQIGDLVRIINNFWTGKTGRIENIDNEIIRVQITECSFTHNYKESDLVKINNINEYATFKCKCCDEMHSWDKLNECDVCGDIVCDECIEKNKETELYTCDECEEKALKEYRNIIDFDENDIREYWNS